LISSRESLTLARGYGILVPKSEAYRQGEGLSSMPADEWLWAKQRVRQKRLVQLERILLGLIVHGPNVLHETANWEFFQWARRYWKQAYRQIVALEREEYWQRQAEAQRPASHPSDCACWDCVLRLQGEMLQHHARMKVEREARRRPMVQR